MEAYKKAEIPLQTEKSEVLAAVPKLAPKPAQKDELHSLDEALVAMAPALRGHSHESTHTTVHEASLNLSRAGNAGDAMSHHITGNTLNSFKGMIAALS